MQILVKARESFLSDYIIEVHFMNDVFSCYMCSSSLAKCDRTIILVFSFSHLQCHSMFGQYQINKV